MSTPNFSDRLIYTVSAGTGEPGELLANREWRICAEKDTNQILLTSLNGEQVWDGPVFDPVWSPDEPPGPSTGVHAFKNRYRRDWVKKDWFYGRRTWAWGWVALSGLVEEFELGYRAEQAAIRQLRLGPRALAHFGSRDEVRDIIAELEDRYQCPVKVGYSEWRVSRTMVPAEGR